MQLKGCMRGLFQCWGRERPTCWIKDNRCQSKWRLGVNNMDMKWMTWIKVCRCVSFVQRLVPLLTRIASNLLRGLMDLWVYKSSEQQSRTARQNCWQQQQQSRWTQGWDLALLVSSQHTTMDVTNATERMHARPFSMLGERASHMLDQRQSVTIKMKTWGE